MHVAVVGAGAFGGWIAYQLLQQGAKVTLFDHWGPGHARASSGGETRLIRGTYGNDEVYTRLVAEAFAEWEGFQKRSGQQVYFPTGSLWLFSKSDDGYARSAMPLLQAQGLSLEEWSIAETRQRYPQVYLGDVQSVFWEKEAGYLMARKACQVVKEEIVKGGGQFQMEQALPGRIEGAGLTGLKLASGGRFHADAYVFACGPWMPKLFPALLGDLITISRQEIHYFGLPPLSKDYQSPNFPIWVDMGERVMYGVSDYDGRGFKVADDTREDPFDPSTADREVSAKKLQQIRSYLGYRFPALKNAPMTEARVCQYSNSPNGHFLLDQHPEADNLFLAGAGCGHGFKLGPSVGRLMAERIMNNTPTPREFQLESLLSAGIQSNQFEH
ncbi:MAG: FAD-dependent oxidoreductase [Saprospiraceae bacterium]|nr:FAD-dependent oxidoreductase [Saprospiraceae bacterium]